MATPRERDAITGTETTGHEWDGIRELNTPLPSWWLYTFYACIAFAAVWVILYPAVPFWGATGVTGWVAREQVVRDMRAAEAVRAPLLDRMRSTPLAQIQADPELRAFAVAGGRAAFAANCASCHGAGGQGAAGGFPALVDDVWIWGGSLAAIYHTIAHGVRNGEDPQARQSMMPRFVTDKLITPAQAGDIAEFVLTFTSRSTDAAAAERGRPLYEQNCSPCHGAGGQGNPAVGAPRLNTRVWLYGGDKNAIIASIANGRGGVMPAWAGRLDPAVINMLAVYVHALGGGE